MKLLVEVAFFLYPTSLFKNSRRKSPLIETKVGRRIRVVEMNVHEKA